MNITDISGIGNATAQLLKTHGIASVEAVAQASIEQLVAVPGIGANRAAALRESARGLLPDATVGAESPEAVPAPAGDAEDGSESVAAPADDGARAKRKKDGKGKKGKKGRKKEGKAEKKKKKEEKKKEEKKKEEKKKEEEKKKKDKGRRKKKNKGK